ncbi:hypothetical protein EMPS_03904 [Entomortierella parvispora]|uniref:Uncharacterized protein n=1 Tax=Entomortierella parvispora TaxID=205924 RepID=A0A9P3H7M0_9FUNG|nr:hypothetical protein EMPS_03904 [Entomortierella parvispora]
MNSTNITLPYVCREVFQPNNVTSCFRFNDVKTCTQACQASDLNSICVTSSPGMINVVGGSKNLNWTATPFPCTVESCPTMGDVTNSSAATKASIITEKSLTLSSALILVLLVSQMVLC